MKIHMFNDAKEGEMSPDHPLTVDLEEALAAIQKQPTRNPKADFDAIIGFQSPWNGILLFREEGDVWKVMLLYRENTLSDWDCSDRDFTTAEVVAIVEEFFKDGKWEELCGVYRVSLARKIWFNALALIQSRRVDMDAD